MESPLRLTLEKQIAQNFNVLVEKKLQLFLCISNYCLYVESYDNF